MKNYLFQKKLYVVIQGNFLDKVLIIKQNILFYFHTNLLKQQQYYILAFYISMYNKYITHGKHIFKMSCKRKGKYY